MVVACVLKDRDGAYVELEDNNCIIGSTAGDELCGMQGLNVHQSRPVCRLILQHTPVNATRCCCISAEILVGVGVGSMGSVGVSAAA